MAYETKLLGGDGPGYNFTDTVFNGCKKSDPKSYILVSLNKETLNRYKINEKQIEFRNYVHSKYANTNDNKSLSNSKNYKELVNGGILWVTKLPINYSINDSHFQDPYNIKNIPHDCNPDDFIYFGNKLIKILKKDLSRNNPCKFRIDFQQNTYVFTVELINSMDFDVKNLRFKSMDVTRIHGSYYDDGHAFYDKYRTALFNKYSSEVLHSVLNFVRSDLEFFLALVVNVGIRLGNRWWVYVIQILQNHHLYNISTQLKSKSNEIDWERCKPDGNTVGLIVVNLGPIINKLLSEFNNSLLSTEKTQFRLCKYSNIKTAQICDVIMSMKVTDEDVRGLLEKGMILLRFKYHTQPRERIKHFTFEFCIKSTYSQEKLHSKYSERHKMTCFC